MLSICSRIIVAYDGSDLSKKALDIAIKIAIQDARIVLNVLTVVSIPSLAEYCEAVREVYFKLAKETSEAVEEKIKTLPNHRKRSIVLEGKPSNVIVEFAKENGANLIIMGSRGLCGLKEFMIGSVSHYVVQKSPCPVFLIK